MLTAHVFDCFIAYHLLGVTAATEREVLQFPVWKNWEYIISRDWKYKTKIGDRFRIDFNFKSNEVTAYYNDELLGVLTTCNTNLDPHLYLAVSVHSCNRMPQKFDTTLFAEQYRN